MTEIQIAQINKLCPMQWQENEQGIFTEPWGIPDNIKVPVIYMRWEIGGTCGGSCWDTSDPQPYMKDNPQPKFECLDLVLKELMPNISLIQFRDVENLIHSTEKTEWEYYGNCTDFRVCTCSPPVTSVPL